MSKKTKIICPPTGQWGGHDKPKKACHSLYGFFFFGFFFYTYLRIYNMYICTHLLITGPAGGRPAEQPLLVLNGKALNQPKPHS